MNLDNNNGDKIEVFIGSNGSDKSLYQTSTGVYIIDENNLEKDDFTINPLLLIKEKKVSRGNITSSVYEFKYDPISLITKDDEALVYIIKIIKIDGLETVLIVQVFI